jgi:hypothetical protein
MSCPFLGVTSLPAFFGEQFGSVLYMVHHEFSFSDNQKSVEIIFFCLYPRVPILLSPTNSFHAARATLLTRSCESSPSKGYWNNRIQEQVAFRYYFIMSLCLPALFFI